jgi:gliding motility-associated-like protein
MKLADQFSVFRIVLLLGVLLMHAPSVNGQYCDSITPSFNVDLSASPYQNWLSPLTDRDGYCCGASAPDVCLEFVITLHPDAAAIVFNIASGAVPPGALFYQIDCGPPTAVGSPICLTGTGPFHLTFCKPGNNTNSFSIETIPNPTFGPDITLANGCPGILYANFYDETTVTWTSVTPGAPGTYDGFLNCTTGCDTVSLTGQPVAPATVGYLVCGLAANGCIPDPVCDTIFTTFVPPVTLAFNAPDTVLCYDQTTLPVQVIPSGGTGPYTYLWDTGETTPGIAAGAGVHTVSVTDQLSCTSVQASVTIVQTPMPTVNAGADIDLCAGFIGTVTLNGTATNTSGVIWTGGDGTFLDSTALSTEYYPTQAEMNGGSLSLTLISNDISGCPPVSDALIVEYSYVSETVALNTTDVTCFGAGDGTVAIAVTGVNGPYSYSFDAGPATTATTDTGLAPGTHTVMIMNALGCDSTLTYAILSPPPVVLMLDSYQDVNCPGGADGWAICEFTDPGPAYQVTWYTNPPQFGSQASGLPGGTYEVWITNGNGCSDSMLVTIAEPLPLALALSAVPPSCYGFANGAASATVSGGTGTYTYAWSSGQTAVNIYNIGAGNYTLTATDANGCTITDAIAVTEPAQLTGIISGDTVVCPNTVFSLATSASGGTGTYSYQWSPGGQTTAAISTSTAADQLYFCTITDNNGCTLNQDVEVTVEMMNAADLTIVATPPVLCLGDSAMLSAAYAGSDPSVVLTWQHCAVCTAETTVMPAVTTEYTIEATNYCGQTIATDITIVVNIPPQIVLTPNSGELCPDELLQFTNAGNNNASWDYLWTFGDGTSSTQAAPQHAYDDPGAYAVSLTVTDNNGCSSTIVNGALITVNPQANASFSVSSTQESILDPEFSFYNNSSDATFYSWTFGDGTSSALTNPTHVYETFGYFGVELYANNPYNCPDSTTLTVEVEPSFDIYIPNSFTPDGDAYNGLFMVKGYGLLEEGFVMEVYDRWGEIIYNSTDIYAGWDGMYAGKMAQDGIYTWVVYFKDLTEREHRVEGHVSLLK